MARARELSEQYADAVDRRDRAAVRAKLPATLEFVTPGGGTLRTADEVLAYYERLWAFMDRSHVVFRNVMESGDAILAEITIEGTIGGLSGAVEGALAHRWHEGKLVRYRFYSDPMPQGVPAELLQTSPQAT